MRRTHASRTCGLMSLQPCTPSAPIPSPPRSAKTAWGRRLERGRQGSTGTCPSTLCRKPNDHDRDSLGACWCPSRCVIDTPRSAAPVTTRDKDLDESGVDPCLMVDCLGDGQCQLLCSHFLADLSPSARNPAQSRAACTRDRRASENRVAKLYARLGQVYQATDTHPFSPSQAEKD